MHNLLGDHPIYAITFMGSCNWHFRGNSGSKSSHHVSTLNGVGDEDSLLEARIPMWCSKLVPNLSAKTATGWAMSKQSAGPKEAVKRDNSPGRIMDEPPTQSTPSQTHQSCGHMDPQGDAIPGLPIQLQRYTSVPIKKISLLTENTTKSAASKHS